MPKDKPNQEPEEMGDVSQDLDGPSIPPVSSAEFERQRLQGQAQQPQPGQAARQDDLPAERTPKQLPHSTQTPRQKHAAINQAAKATSNKSRGPTVRSGRGGQRSR